MKAIVRGVDLKSRIASQPPAAAARSAVLEFKSTPRDAPPCHSMTNLRSGARFARRMAAGSV
ncbi:hypothetical protein B1812_12180 [Methylocystis bryophila]|uniref:Uncharacterized protein n=1 Tax=Methylocystis bryophila TaxID=655015 RepID=A0A1W6MVR9_9HYPH|nr:hypothetical protein B1812_12180 [Methylocystis bryophila]